MKNGGAKARTRARLTYANVMSTIAVFGVLAGGGAYAAGRIGADDIAQNAVRSKHIKDGEVKTSDLANGAVSGAKLAGGALSAPVTEVVPYPLVNNNCGLARTGEFCGNGTNPEVESIRAWRNNGDGYAPAGFFKDRAGVVHLEGSVEVSAPQQMLEFTIFILPPGFRPTEDHVYPVHDASASGQFVTVGADGQVVSSDRGTTQLSLDGINFRAG
jgi:hypothetical protein